MTPEPPAAVAEHAEQLRTAIEAFKEKADNAVAHVGAANYRERQEEAQEWVEEAYASVEQLLDVPPKPVVSPDDQSAKKPDNFILADEGDVWSIYVGSVTRENWFAKFLDEKTARHVCDALNFYHAPEAKESVLRASSAEPPSSSTDRAIVALRQVYEALQGVAIGASRRRVCEAALILLGEK